MLALFVLAAFVAAQQVYIHGEGLSPLPSCSGHGVLSPPTPSYQSKGFRYSLTETTRTALSVTVASTGSFALPYSAASHLLANVSTTSWGNWSPNATKPTDVSDPYGQAAWSALWDQAAPQNWTTGVYSTTASPTPVPTSSLILPPPRYFQPSDNCYTFHEDFILGVAGAAAQIEGAVAHEGRSPAFPDIVPAIIPVQQSIVTESLPYYGVAYDYVANEGYYLYKRDIDRLAAVGVKYYSFSIAWSRILPFGLPSTPVNSEAIAHYDDVIAYVVSKGMLPLITLHHYDTPLQFYGSNYTNSVQDTKLYMANWDLGLQNDTFQDAFVNYGKIVMTHFANRVPVWFSINEPQAGATGGAAVHNVIRAHARLAHFYREELNGTGKFSMKMGSASGVPEVPTNASHLAAVQHYDDLQLGTFLKPLVLGRDYPEAFKMTLQDYAPLTAQDLAYMAGTMGMCERMSMAPYVSLTSSRILRRHRLLLEQRDLARCNGHQSLCF